MSRWHVAQTLTGSDRVKIYKFDAGIYRVDFRRPDGLYGSGVFATDYAENAMYLGCDNGQREIQNCNTEGGVYINFNRQGYDQVCNDSDKKCSSLVMANPALEHSNATKTSFIHTPGISLDNMEPNSIYIYKLQ
ncbi:MAG: hypothetical protein LBL52_00440 [Rickettsiales bacterium]|nr:hypothetical protein [Rickettsiales bacterium]